MHQIISIEGNIGSGKSTLLKNLKNHYANNENIVFLKEPVDEWEQIKDDNNVTMLEKFYADQERYSFPFQMMAYISRLAILKETIKNHPNAIIITERSLYTDKMVFAKMLHNDNKIETINYKIYLKWFDTFANDFPVHKIIYVNAEPEICSERIKKRSRLGESNIPLDYLQNCHHYHNEMLNKENQDCVCHEQLVLDGNIDIYENDGHLEKWIEQIDLFVNDK